ncbi:MAG TPA: response regulator [Nannocystaceae bacterium]|nr:response regulator [Nannocystaceae bacterium]
MAARPILLIEDDRDDETLVRRALSSSQVPNTVIVARDGAEALDYLFALGDFKDRDLAEQPALILLDISLPKIDGFEVLRQIRADPLTRRLPVVVLTSSRRQTDVLSGYDAGANAYVVKPVDVGRFVEATQELGRFWARLNELPAQPAS